MNAPLRAMVASAIVATVALSASTALAADLGARDDLASVEVHGFATQGFILTLANNYLVENSTHGSAALSEVGINFTKELPGDLRLGFQLLAQVFGPVGEYSAQFDWFYVDYHHFDWLGLRAGRVRIPFGLYNDIRDIDAARVPILLPPSVYPFNVSTLGFAQTGGELYGYGRVGDAGALEYRAYGGTFPADPAALGPRPFTPTDLNTTYIAGGRLLWETPLEGLHVAASFQAFQLHYTANFAETPTTPAVGARIDLFTAFALGSLEYSYGNWLLAAEYGRWLGQVDSSNTGVFPSSSRVSERGYVMAAYRVASWLQPGLYYSLLFPDVHHRDERQDVQHDVAATLRFDINPYWLFKVEGHLLMGTAAFNPIGGVTLSALNGGIPLSGLTTDWGAFLLSTTGYF